MDIMFGSNLVPARSQQQHPMMMCMPPNMMPPIMMPPNMMPPNMMMRLPQPMTQAPQGGADFSSIPGYRKGMETAVTTGSIAIWKLPNMRLTECLEFVEPKLDATLTACVPSQILVIMLWELTHTKIQMKVQELRCHSYLEVYQRFRCAAERRKAVAELPYKEYVEWLTKGVDETAIIKHAVEQGFDPDWLRQNKRKGEDRLRVCFITPSIVT